MTARAEEYCDIPKEQEDWGDEKVTEVAGENSGVGSSPLKRAENEGYRGRLSLHHVRDYHAYSVQCERF